MTDTVILSKVDTAANSAEFVVKYNRPVTAYVYPFANLTTGEFVNLQRKDPEDTFQVVFDHSFAGSGGQVRLSDVVTEIVITGPGVYRFDKDDPTSAVGVAISETDHG